MNQIAVAAFLDANREYLFPNKKYSQEQVVVQLLGAPESFQQTVGALCFQKPSTALLQAVFLGFFGIDRLLTKNYFLGLLKMFSAGGYYVLWILDALTAKKRCRNRNCEKLQEALRTAEATERVYATYRQPPATSAAPAQPATYTAPAQSAQTAGPRVEVDTDADVFLSYSHRDKSRLLPLFAELERGGLRVWYDEGIRAGAEWEEEIVSHLAQAPGFLFFVSEHSLTSQNCRDELFQARKRNKQFINILVDDVDMSKPEFEWFDFRYSRYQQIPAYSMSYQEVVEKVRSGLKLK